MSIRIISKKELRQLVLYSPAHIDRLEKAGRFPKRVQLGPCRVGWVESEVLEWLQARIDERNKSPAASEAIGSAENVSPPRRSPAGQDI